VNQIVCCDWLSEQLAIFCMPALKISPKPYIRLNRLLAKLVRSRWLDSSLFLFMRVSGPGLCLDP